MPYEAKTNWKYDDTVTEKDLNRIEQGLKDAHVAEYKDITLQPGVQIVDVPVDTPFHMGEIRGRTLINLLGNNSNVPEKWDTPRVQCTSKNGYIKVVPKSGITYDLYAENCVRANTLANKFYVLIADVYNENATVQLRSIIYNAKGEPIDDIRSEPIGDTVASPIFLTFQTPNDAIKISCRIQILNTKADGNNVLENSIVYFKNYRLFEITQTDKESIALLSSDQVAKRYPFVNSLSNVFNPYISVISGNLVPPFTEWNSGFNGVATEPYTQWVTTSGDRANSSTQISALEGLTYTLSIERIGDGEIGLDFRDAQNNVLQTSDFVKTTTITATAPPGTIFVNVWTSAPKATAKGYAFRNPMLTIGSVPKSFKPQVRSMWATESQLAAHPVDGTNADVLYVGDDGVPYVLEKWRRIVFDGSLEYELYNSYTGGKCVRVKFNHSDANVGLYPYLIKYDGTILQAGTPSSATDVFSSIDWINSSTATFLGVGISENDSGWGDSYTPTTDEIKAYFLGWKMYAGDVSPTQPYNRTDGLYKKWCYRDPFGADGLAGGTEMLPTTQAPITTTWQPYRLQYLKEKPTAEPASNYETGLTLSKGWNMVEVGSGVVIREKANPTYYSPNGNYYINNTAVSGSLLKNKVSHMPRAYRNGRVDNTAKIENDANAYGKQHVRFLPSNYDPYAVYHVTYMMLDPTLTATISGSIATNLSGTVTDIVQWAADAEQRLSVVENQKAEKGVPQWISPTLINGWVNRNIGKDAPAGYLKDQQGFVHFRGIVFNETAGANNIFYLPEGYRPSRRLQFINLSANASAGLITSYITIEVSGAVYFNAGAVTHWLSLDNITFLAEQ